MKGKNHFAVIVAAGQGLRMESGTKKQYMLLKGIPILARTVMAFYALEDIRKIVLVVPKDDLEYCASNILSPYGLSGRIHLVAGGHQRQESVSYGLQYLHGALDSKEEAVVLIHDGVRPFVNQRIILDCLGNVTPLCACVPALEISDTVKLAHPDLTIQKTLNRENLFLIQTPQCFYLNSICDAYDHAVQTRFRGTDDASVFEHFGGKVKIIKGSKTNIKITTPEDLELGELYLSKS